MLNCYKPGTIFNGPKNYSLYFQINSIKQLDFPISEYFYFLNNSNYYFISPNDFNNTINLIDLYSENILYAKNSEGNIIASFYDYIYYKISFEKYSNHKGKFLRKIYSRIFPNNSLRYELSKDEKYNKGIHLKLKIGIFNNLKNRVSELQDFNFFICLKGYQFLKLMILIINQIMLIISIIIVMNAKMNILIIFI